MRLILDGPSIMVRVGQGVERRIPIRWLERVVVVGNMELESQLLSRLAAQGIPVLLVERESLKSAVVYKVNENGVQIKKRQHMVFRKAPLSEHVSNWMRSKRREMILKTIKKYSPRLVNLFLQDGNIECKYQQLIKILKRNIPSWDTVIGLIRSMMFELLLTIIKKTNFDPHCGAINRGIDFGFVLDLLWIMEPEVDYQAVRFFRIPSRRNIKLLSKGNQEFREIVHRFENRKKLVDKEVKFFLDELIDLMRRVDGELVSGLLRRC